MKVILTILVLLISESSYSQEKNDFQNLLSIFKLGQDNEIPIPLAKKYFGFEPNDDPNIGNKVLYSGEIVLENEEFIGLSTYRDCGAGGICQITSLSIFDKQGNQIDREPFFESHFADCSFNNSRFCSYSSDSLLIVINKEEKGDCLKDSMTIKKIITEFFYINDYGIISRGINHAVDIRRKYYELSIDILDDQELVTKNKCELEIMRNEIFAAHGYKFKTPKWLTYFQQTIWYKPQFENVDHLLTEIEKKNIDKIIKYENE
jgi:hypothetical protein